MSKSVRRPCGLYPSRLLCLWDSPGKNTAGGCHALLQGIFPTQGTDIFKSKLKVKTKQKPILTGDKTKQRFLTSISNFNIEGVFYKLMLNATWEAVWVYTGMCIFTRTNTSNIESARIGCEMR